MKSALQRMRTLRGTRAPAPEETVVASRETIRETVTASRETIRETIRLPVRLPKPPPLPEVREPFEAQLPADPALKPLPSDNAHDSAQKINGISFYEFLAPDPAWKPLPTDELHDSWQKINALWWELAEQGGVGGTGIEEAPIDGNVYTRKDRAWQVLDPDDAPDDGNLYARYQHTWRAIVGDDAPTDGLVYGRHDGGWTNVAAGVLPPGGERGQSLQKRSALPGDAMWSWAFNVTHNLAEMDTEAVMPPAYPAGSYGLGAGLPYTGLPPTLVVPTTVPLVLQMYDTDPLDPEDHTMHILLDPSRGRVFTRFRRAGAWSIWFDGRGLFKDLGRWDGDLNFVQDANNAFLSGSVHTSSTTGNMPVPGGYFQVCQYVGEQTIVQQAYEIGLGTPPAQITAVWVRQAVLGVWSPWARSWPDARLDDKVDRAGDVMTGTLDVAGTLRVTPSLATNRATFTLLGNDYSGIGLSSADLIRWTLESSVFAGINGRELHDFTLVQFDDIGRPISYPLRIRYTDGRVELQQPRTVSGDPVDDNDLTRKAYVDRLITGTPLFIGTIDASTGDCNYTPASGFPDGPLIPPTPDTERYVLICVVAGTIPSGPGQGIVLNVGDWLLSNGTAWNAIPVGSPANLARFVTVLPTVFGTDNVQEELEAAKVEIDAALARGIPTWTAGANYTVGQIVFWDGITFKVLIDIPNAPAIPDFATIKVVGASQGDYWRGTPQGWVTNYWMHLITMPCYGSYRVQMDLFGNGVDESIILEIATTYNQATMNVVNYARNPGNKMVNQFRLSATAANADVRLEMQIRSAGTGPDFKIFISGFARQNNSNTTVIQKPPTGQVADLGGSTRATLNFPTESGAGMLLDNVALRNGAYIKFAHSNPTDANDGKIGTRLFGPGLNLVGAVTEAGDLQRHIGVWGNVTFRQNGDLIFLNDGFGLITNGGGRFYKKVNTGVTIRCHTANTQPGIENNDGSNRRDIIDTVNGDARYVNKTGDSMSSHLTMNNGNVNLRAPNTNNEQFTPSVLFGTSDGRNSAGFSAVKRGENVGVNHGHLYCHVACGGWGWQEVFHTEIGSPPWVDFRARPRVNGVPVVMMDQLGALIERVRKLEREVVELKALI